MNDRVTGITDHFSEDNGFCFVFGREKLGVQNKFGSIKTAASRAEV